MSNFLTNIFANLIDIVGFYKVVTTDATNAANLQNVFRRCINIANIYSGLPFHWSNKYKQLEPLETTTLRLRFYLSLVFFILILCHFMLEKKSLPFPLQMFVGYAYLCCFMSLLFTHANIKFSKLTCRLCNYMHRFNNMLVADEHHITPGTLEVQKLNFLISFVLCIVTAPIYSQFLILVYPCLPLFGFNWFLPECNSHLYWEMLQTPPIPVFIKIGSVLASLLNFSFLVVPPTFHVCLVMYHGFCFTFQINNYCRYY